MHDRHLPGALTMAPQRPHGTQRFGDARGQSLAVFAVVLLAMMSMVGLIIDGGNAFAQQRLAQNGADAAAEAGAVVLAQRLAGYQQSAAAVASAIQASGAANTVALESAVYTDINGDPLLSGGAPVSVVGATAIPTGAAGVHVGARRTFATYVAGVIGMTSFSSSASATAVVGYQASPCDSGTGCGAIALTVPVNGLTCDGSGNTVPSAQVWPTETLVVIPLCKQAAGNVGWLDWGLSGGASALAESIVHPRNPGIALPSWMTAAQTGNPNSSSITDALNSLAGETVLVPLFRHWCSSPLGTGLTQVSDCPAASLDQGGGTKTAYYFSAVGAFQLCGASVAGCGTVTQPFITSPSQCDQLVGGNGGTSCIVGFFRSGFVTTGVVERSNSGGTGSPVRQVVVQLIR